MHLYFASPIAKNLISLKQEKAKKFLVSYATKSVCVSIINKRILTPEDSLIIDSGAFSAWTKGVVINLEKYIEFCKWVIEQKPCDIVYFVNLDKIPGSFGVKPTKDDIEESAKVGLENYKVMKSAGLKVIPVFHQHEDFKWLKEMMKETDYIGISPANDVSVKKRIAWLRKVYTILGTDYKTHLFGFTAFEALKIFPCYSADSTSWLAPARYGQYSSFGNGKIKTHSKRNLTTVEAFRLTEKIGVSVLMKQSKEILKIEDFITRLWKKRGIKWD